MNRPVFLSAAVLVLSAALLFMPQSAYAEEENGAVQRVSEASGMSASEKAVQERIKAEKAAIEAANTEIENAAFVNRFTSDSIVAGNILAEKAAISKAHEAVERASEMNKQKEYADIVDSMPDHTYIDIDLTKQTLTYYINGGVTISSDIVSGNVSRNCDTPQGVYQIYGKQRKRTLRGPNYSAFVNYWMPFTGNYGIHDATWRSSFGGDIYRTNGSHGCVNISKSTAAILYETAPVGTRVFVHL
ncbi:MAG: L,D-transpeptidase [Lachnospiraceae bacterium]|nr:L,D-transpeptidase [Lachnospiraceae bacterium]